MRNGECSSNRKSLQLEEVSVSVLQLNPRNARTHSKRQIRQIEASIHDFGWTNPVLIDEDNQVIAGHGRLAAAELLQLAEVPTIRLRGLTEPKKRALALADNKLAENAGWNPEILAQELKFLSEIEINFEVEITGFSTAEIDLVIEEGRGEAADDRADTVPPVPEGGATCVRRGDIWRLGPHRLMCGDATDPGSFAHLMAGKRAQMAITDPPYNVAVDGNACGLGTIRHREFAMAAGEMTVGQFAAFLEMAFQNMARHSMDGAIHYVFMDWRHLFELLTAGGRVYTELKNICIWNKSNAGMGSLYRSKHEMIAVLKTGRAPHINNVELGRHGRYRSNVWDYAGINTFGAGRLDELAMHPTVKPVALFSDAILDCSKRGGIVLDPFAGSGTTIIATERTGRIAYAMELDSGYVETAIRRWEHYTGETVIHVETGLTLEALSNQRSLPADSDHDTPRLSPTTGSTTPIEEATYDE